MVDSIGSISQIGNISSANNKSQALPKGAEDVASSRKADEVNISAEALKLSDIEEITKRVANELHNDKTATLSSNLESLNKLA